MAKVTINCDHMVAASKRSVREMTKLLNALTQAGLLSLDCPWTDTDGGAEIQLTVPDAEARHFAEAGYAVE